MRKLLLSTVLAVSAVSVVAQPRKKVNPIASHLSLGPVVSLGHSWVSNIPGDRDFKFAPALGIGLVYSKNEHLGFGAQLLISHEGYKQELQVTSAVQPPGKTLDITINPVYLRVPLHVIYFFGNYGDRIRPKIYAGPSIALKVDETRRYSDNAYKPADGTPGAADLFSRGDFGLSTGLGANVRLNKATWLNLDASYYHGLVDVVDRTTADNGFNGNRNLRLSIGLMWGI